MTAKFQGQTPLCWIARIWSVLSIAFLLVMFIGEMMMPSAALPNFAEGVLMLFFPVGVLIGMLLAWKKELPGALVTIVSIVAFYAGIWLLRGNLPRGPYFLLVAAPGLLFLADWWLYHRETTE